MVLKEFECSGCGTLFDAMANGADLSIDMSCPFCGKSDSHPSICTGGCKRRYRFNDWSGVDLTGAVTVDGFKCEHVVGATWNPETEQFEGGRLEPLRNRQGKRIDDFHPDIMAAKIDRRRFEHNRRLGRLPIRLFNGKN